MTMRGEKKSEAGGKAGAGPLFSVTGNPFVDSGLAAMCSLLNVDHPGKVTRAAIEKKIPWLVDVYCHENWTRVFQGMIFPNSKLGNPSIRNRKAEYRKLLDGLLDSLSPPHSSGSCVACGRRDGQRVDKTMVPLLGSQPMANFFAAWSTGEPFCANCLLAVQFMPLAIEKIGRMQLGYRRSRPMHRRALLMHTVSWEILLAYAKRNTTEALRIAAAKEPGIVDMGYKAGATLNAIFSALTEIVQDPDVQVMPLDRLIVPLRFYTFSSDGRNPILEFYDIPSAVVDYLIAVQRSGLASQWDRVVAKGFVVRKEEDPNEAPYIRENQVYRRIVEDRSILRYFFEDRQRMTVIGSWELVSLYLRRLRNMDEERIQTIKDVADRILEICKAENSLKLIQILDRAKYLGQFRTVLLRMHKLTVAKKGQPLLTFDELVDAILPDERQWSEVRDLLLFRIYEAGASWLSDFLKKEEDVEGDIEELVETMEVE